METRYETNTYSYFFLTWQQACLKTNMCSQYFDKTRQ